MLERHPSRGAEIYYDWAVFLMDPERDPDKALELLHKVNMPTEACTMFQMGVLYNSGMLSSGRDPEKAKEMFRIPASHSMKHTNSAVQHAIAHSHYHLIRLDEEEKAEPHYQAVMKVLSLSVSQFVSVSVFLSPLFLLCAYVL